MFTGRNRRPIVSIIARAPLVFALAGVLGVQGCSNGFGDCEATRTCPPGPRSHADASTTGNGGSDAGETGGAAGSSGIGSGTAGTTGNSGGASGVGGGGGAGGMSDGSTTTSDAGVGVDANGGDECPAGYADCDGRRDNGCEVDVTKDLDHCGKCDVVCSGDGTTGRTCSAGVCSVACDATHADCDHDAKNGCEVDLQSDGAHCGACDAACASAGTTQNACVAGVCKPVCDGTHADCDKDGKNGCEIDLKADPDHCGACGNACSGSGTATRACVAGVCKPACDATHGDCDGDGKNGCEVDLKSNPDHCGACATVCSSKNVKGRVCAAGACTPVCATGYDDCTSTANDGCETSLSAPDTCGSCTHSCLGGSCTQMQCQPLALGSSLPTPHGVAVDDKFVHWVDGTSAGGRVMRVGLNGGASRPINTTSEANPYDIVSDGQYMYWSTLGDAQATPQTIAIRRYIYSNNTLEDVVTAKDFPNEVVNPVRIALDEDVFWVNGFNGAAAYAIRTLPGVASEAHGIVGLSSGAAIAVDPDTGYVYTAFLDLYRSSRYANPMPLHLLAGNAFALTLDSAYVYYPLQDSKTGAENLVAIGKDFAGMPKTVASTTISPTSPLVADATYLYYADASNLYRVPKAGGTPQPLSNQVNSVFAIVVTKNAVYWSNTGDAAANGSIMKLALP